MKSGRLRKVAPRVYTSNLSDKSEAIVFRNLYLILGKLYSGAVLSHRTALEGGPAESGDIYLTYKYSRKANLPGICVHLLKGPGPTEDDMPFLEGLFMSCRPRAFLENMQVSRSRTGVRKVLPKAAVEERLDRICSIQGVEAVTELRDRARMMAEALEMNREFQRLNRLIGAILRTRPADELSSPQARARSVGAPYDSQRLASFNRLFASLAQSDFPVRRESRQSQEESQLLAFFEAYFSNYIEGTEFEILEAYDIVFRGKVPQARPQDAHDIMGTFRIVSNGQEMQRVPESFDQFLALLRSRHLAVMEARRSALPGEFKRQPNRAGQTHFVTPELVRGTLLKGFEMYAAVETGLARAVFMMFLVSDVHPFVDGNGRVARIMMNAELTRAGLCRIIIPTVFRDDYLLALRAMSRSDNPGPLIKAMDYAQRFCSVLPFTSYDAAANALRESNAFSEPDEARLRLPGQPE